MQRFNEAVNIIIPYVISSRARYQRDGRHPVPSYIIHRKCLSNLLYRFTGIPFTSGSNRRFPLILNEISKFLHRHRSGIQIALSIPASQLQQKFFLLRCLDSLADNLHIQPLPQVDNIPEYALGPGRFLRRYQHDGKRQKGHGEHQQKGPIGQ